MRRGKDGGTTGVVEVEEEEVGVERLAHREGRRRLVGRAGLEKFFWTEEEGTEDSLLPCGETNELPFRVTLLTQQSVSHTQILYILSRVPSVVFLTLGKTTGTFQTGTLIHSAHKCGKVTHPFSLGHTCCSCAATYQNLSNFSALFGTMLLWSKLNLYSASNYILLMKSNKIGLIIIPTISLTFA